MYAIYNIFVLSYFFHYAYLSSPDVTITAITEPVQHAEGPFCDTKNETLYYVDTFKATAYRYHLPTGERTSYKIENRNSIAVVIPIADAKDQFIVGADRYLYRLTWPTCKNQKPTLKELLMVEDHNPKSQFNDGKIDSKGRLWLGTLTRNEDLTVPNDGGNLYMFKGEDLPNFEKKIPKTSISNGLAWSSDGKNFYFADTAPGLVFGYKYDEATGKISGKTVVLDMKDHPELKGLPDGMTIDSSDNLWVALFGGHAVINVDPRTSEIIQVLKMPATYITSACFGGPQLDTLFVTSSRLHLNDDQLKEEPSAGSVFAVTNLGVRGLPANEYYDLCDDVKK